MAITTDYSGTSASNKASSGSASTALSSDYDTFLKMLTTQMRNQDPLNPVDSSDYAQQLATFSGVEQQIQTNTLLTTLIAQMGTMSMSQLAGWIGQQARAQIDVPFDGSTPVTLSPNPATLADRAVLAVRDSSGNLVAREDIPLGASDYAWQGLDAAGATLPAGTYRISLESYRDEELLSTEKVESYARIVEVQGSSSGTTLVLQGGARVSASDITALRTG